MIPAAALDAYLDRALDSHLWMKELDEGELDDAIDALKPVATPHENLRLHQKVCFLLGIAYPGFAFWLDMGTGKTLLALELLQYWFDARRIQRAVVLVTSDKAFSTWEKQVKQFNIEMPVITLEGSSQDKWRTLEEHTKGLVLVTYPGAVAMCSEKVPKKGRKKAHMVLSPRRVEQLSCWAQGLVLDESTRVGHHTSLTHKLANKLRQRAFCRYALAGRPFGRDPTILQPQMKVVDHGDTLGENLGLFRAAFFREEKVHWDRSGRARNYIFDRKKEGDLSRMLQHRSITYDAKECIDLPPVTPIIDEVSFPSEAETYYRRVIDQLIAAKGNYHEMENAFLTMRQVSSGFVGVRDDETGDRAEIEFAENPKLERLLELAEDTPEGHKMVIFYDFTYSGRRISKELLAQGDKNCWLWSGTKDHRAEMERFLTDPEYRFMILQNRIGAYALDGLQRVANYTVFYESPVSAIDREQAERRLVRDGQELPVMQYDLVVKGSYDRRILDFHREGEELMKVLLRDPARFLEE